MMCRGERIWSIRVSTIFFVHNFVSLSSWVDFESSKLKLVYNFLSKHHDTDIDDSLEQFEKGQKTQNSLFVFVYNSVETEIKFFLTEFKPFCPSYKPMSVVLNHFICLKSVCMRPFDLPKVSLYESVVYIVYNLDEAQMKHLTKSPQSSCGK